MSLTCFNAKPRPRTEYGEREQSSHPTPYTLEACFTCQAAAGRTAQYRHSTTGEFTLLPASIIEPSCGMRNPLVRGTSKTLVFVYGAYIAIDLGVPEYYRCCLLARWRPIIEGLVPTPGVCRAVGSLAQPKTQTAPFRRRRMGR